MSNEEQERLGPQKDNHNPQKPEQTERRQELSRENQTLPDSKNIQVSTKQQQQSKDVPNLQLVPNTDDTSAISSSISEVWSKDGGRVLRIENGDRVSSIEYNSSGQPIRYTAVDGEVFINRGPQEGSADPRDFWESNNPVSKGAYIKVDDNRTIDMTDVKTGNEVTRTVGGVETVRYKDAGQTTTKFEGNTEWITVEDKNRPGFRMLQIEKDDRGGKLKSYTDRDGNTFVRTEMRTPGNKEYKQRPIFNKQDSGGNVIMEERDGQMVPAEFTISLDRTGNVCVRKYGQHHASDEQFAVRELNNGTITTSNADNSVRRTQTSDGLAIEERKQADGGLAKTIEYANGNKMQVFYDVNEQLTGIDGTIDGKAFKLAPDPLRKISEHNGQIVSRLDNGMMTVINQDGSVTTTTDKDAQPPVPSDFPPIPKIISKVPPRVDLEKNILEAENHPVGYGQWLFKPLGDSIDNGYYFKGKVEYGAEYDFKTPGGEYITDREFEDYGNWHYGVVGGAAQWSEVTLLQEAGVGQVNEKTSSPEYGSPGYGLPGMRFFSSGNNGDEPEDQELIKQGYAWYEQRIAQQSKQKVA